MRPFAFLTAYVIPLSFLIAASQRGNWWVLVPIVAFVLIPIADILSGYDEVDPSEEDRNVWFDIVLQAWVPLQLLCLVLGVQWAVDVGWSGELVGAAVALGILTGGGGITVAHELMHRKSKWEKALSEVLMTEVSYTWFCVEHIAGHHRNVATPKDPASAELGETIYGFVPKSVWGGFKSAWAIETARCERRKLPWYSWKNKRLRMGLSLAAVWALVIGFGGVAGAAFFAIQSAIAVLLLEIINFVEHYGLRRAEESPGRYERVKPHHSWNSTQRLTNRFLFNLPRHADHHAWAFRRYDELKAWPDAPALPYGYPTMVLIALVPPLWRAIVDPRVAQVTQAQVQPAK